MHAGLLDVNKCLSIASEQPQTLKLPPAGRDQCTLTVVADSLGLHYESQLGSCCRYAGKTCRHVAMQWSAAVYLAKKAQDKGIHVMLTLPPVLLARHDTTTSAGSLNAVLRRESLLLTSPKLTSAPLKSCTWSGLC